MKRKTEVYKINMLQRNADLGEIRKKELEEYTVLNDFLEYFFLEYKHTDTNDRKEKLNSKDICFFIDQVEKETEMYKVVLKYLKFNKATSVKNINTLQVKYTKDKNDGDEERQHYLIKTYDNINRAILVYEKLTGAVTIGMINNHMNKAFRKWVKENYEDDDCKEILKFEIKIQVVPSQDFINELSSMDKISLLRITVDKEKITSDEDILYSGDNVVRKDIDIVYKPIKSLSLTRGSVVKYFEMQQSNKEKINRVVINGKINGNNITLDTERMKLSEYIETNLDIDGLVESKDILAKYVKLVNERFNTYFNEIINKEIVVEVDESEE